MADPTYSLPPIAEAQRSVQVLVVHPWRQGYWLHVLLLLLTFFTTLVVGARIEYNFQHNLPAFYEGDDSLAFFPAVWALEPSHLLMGVPFSLSLMLILLAHEMGHYLYCKRYQVWATLPFFIPFPTLFGTLGAFIRIRSPIRSRDALFDIGIAGPIAGFVVASTVLWISLGLSRAPAPHFASDAVQLHYPLIFYVMHAMRAGLLPHGIDAAPLTRVALHPMAIAAWIGMFATALNLLPGGQLDGGHIVFSLAPDAHRTVSRLTILALVLMAYTSWAGWLLWAALLAISGMRHPVVPRWPEAGRGRRALAVFGLLMLMLTFVPAPVANSSLPETVRTIRQQMRQ